MHGSRSSSQATASSTGDGASSRERELAVLRIADEALHNALRHASRARRSSCGSRPREAGVEVADDGWASTPSDPELRARHLGLTSMEERARELGAS